jgi:hypothetical protein
MDSAKGGWTGAKRLEVLLHFTLPRPPRALRPNFALYALGQVDRVRRELCKASARGYGFGCA